MIIKKCSQCDNNIRIHPKRFPIANDNGGFIVQCDNDKCKKLSFHETINPVETYISKGAKKIDIWDIDVTTKKNALSKYPDIQELREGVLVIGDLEKREYEFNFNTPHIFHCSKCDNEVESIVKAMLEVESQNIAKQYDGLINYILANHRASRDNLIVEIKAICKCNHSFVSYWHKKITANNKSINPTKDLFLLVQICRLKVLLLTE